MTYFRDSAGFGDWMSDLAAAGSANINKITTQAEALGDKFTNWARDQEALIKKDAFAYFYTQTRVVLDKVGGDSAIKNYVNVAGQTYDAAVKSIDTLGALIKSDFATDPSGIVDTARAGQALVSAIGGIAKLAGANADIVDSGIGWAGVGLGCVAGFAAGPIGGIVGCASALLLKMLDSGPPMQWYSVLAGGTHFNPQMTRAQLAMSARNAAEIQTDALRLATVLKYHYGFTSCKQLEERILQGSPCYESLGPGLGGGCYGWGTYYPPAGTPTATTLVDIAKIMNRGRVVDAAYAAPLYGIPNRFAGAIESKDWNRNIGNYPFREFGDVSAAIVESMAAAARAAIAGSGTAFVPTGMVDGAYGVVATAVDMAPWIFVDELINFFGAVTLRQLFDTATVPVERVYLAESGVGLPVWMLSVDEGRRMNCWTANDVDGECTVYSLAARVRASKQTALRDFGALRLMAAMSYLIMTYHRSSGESDLIAEVPMFPFDDLRYQLSVPIDPRTVMMTGSKPFVAPYGTEMRYLDYYKLLYNEGLSPGPREKIQSYYLWPSNKTGYIELAMRQVGTWRGNRLGARRGPAELGNEIKQREDFYGPIKRAAMAAAQGDSNSSVQIALSTQRLGVIGSQIAMQSQIQQQLGARVVLQTKSQMEQDCIAGGGYFSDGGCKPSAAFEQACRDAGGTPTWNEYEKFRCPGSSLTIQQLGELSKTVGAQQVASGQAPTPGTTAAPAGGGIGSIALLAGAALLLTKFMK